MSDNMDGPESGATMRPPPTGSRYLESGTIEWQPTEFQGFWIKPLYENPECGQKAMLMKADAGAFAPLHSHAEIEQIYVLEGSLYDDRKVLKAGDYCCRAAGATHSAGTQEGAMMLLIYTKVAA